MLLLQPGDHVSLRHLRDARGHCGERRCKQYSLLRRAAKSLSDPRRHTEDGGTWDGILVIGIIARLSVNPAA